MVWRLFPLASRDLRRRGGVRTRLFAGLVTSMIGDSLMLLVFAIWVKKLTGSNSAAGMVMLSIAAVIGWGRRRRVTVPGSVSCRARRPPRFRRQA
jgi:hypothetical protein